jgi:hypothetical protein
VKHFAHDVEFRLDFKLDFKPTSISDGFRSAASCCAFFGNDTGFSHVLASFGRPVFVMTPFPKVSVKNPPLGGRTHIELFGETPAKIAAKFAEFMKWN